MPSLSMKMRSQGFEPWSLVPFSELPAWRAEVLDCPPEGSRLDDDRAGIKALIKIN
jgi:hypothetical protein